MAGAQEDGVEEESLGGRSPGAGVGVGGEGDDVAFA
jgi:hypothetical protein